MRRGGSKRPVPLRRFISREGKMAIKVRCGSHELVRARASALLLPRRPRVEDVHPLLHLEDEEETGSRSRAGLFVGGGRKGARGMARVGR